MLEEKFTEQKTQKKHAAEFVVNIVKRGRWNCLPLRQSRSNMSNLVVGVACHGYSSEATISMQSAKTVMAHLQKQYSSLFYLKITSNKWFVVDTEGHELEIPVGQFTFEYKGQRLRFDVLFNALHGSPGEDGKLAALLELASIPHTSCDMYPAALTFNKRDCIAIARRLGVPTAPSITLDKGDRIDLDEIQTGVGFPCFVKANRAGSSFGVFKVAHKEELQTCIHKAFEEDSQLIIEQALEGREVSVGVLRLQDQIKVLPITEIITENGFFDYAAKYEGQSQEITPAGIPKEWEESVSHWAHLLYDKLDLKGITRSEFIFVDGVPHLLEINTVPGMTQASIIPQQAQAAGIKLDELFSELLKTALKRNT